MHSPEVKNVQQYTDNYAALARALGSDRAQPHPDELALLERTARHSPYHWGSLSKHDIYFLTALVSILQPAQALEIGTASGSSAALLAQVMARSYAERGEPLPETLLHTIDRKDRCLFDESKPIGFQVAELPPDLAARVRIHTLGDSSLAPSLFQAGTLPFAFVDGNHQHPWPLLDLLHILPVMRPGGWIVLDDVNQPVYHPGADARFGPRYLFEAWLGERVEGWNVGAVRVSADLGALKPMVDALLAKPFEVKETGWKRYRKQLAALTEALWPAEGETAEEVTAVP